MAHGFTAVEYVRGKGRARVPGATFDFDSNMNDTALGGINVVTGDPAHSKGSYIEIIGATAQDAYGLYMSLANVSGNSQFNGTLVDIATGTAGNESVIIPNIDAGNAGPRGFAGSHALTLWFPGLFIPSGSRIAARSQGVNVSDACTMHLFVEKSFRYDPWSTTVIAYGADTANSRGTSVTPASGAFGTWTEIGTTSRAHTFWTVSVDMLADTGVVAIAYLVQIGYGPDSDSVTPIGGHSFALDVNEGIAGPYPSFSVAPVPNGTKVWARIAEGGADARGVVIYGI